MSDREDRKLREVPVATYQYRHEAEFAAGFLKDAGIPYRLQIDDPALGIIMSTSARIWVAAIDERRARDILATDRALQPMDEEDTGAWDDEAADEGPSTARAGPIGTGARRVGTRDVAGRRSEPAVDVYGNPRPDLTLRQRLISLGGSVAVSSILGIEAVREAGVVAVMVIALLGASLALVAVFGRAPAFVTRILAGLSGDAP